MMINKHHFVQSADKLLLQPPPTTSPCLKESLRINIQSSLQRQSLGLRLDTTPVVLTVVCVVHEERSVYVRKKTVIDVLLDEVVHSLVEVLVCLVDFLVVDGECVGEV